MTMKRKWIKFGLDSRETRLTTQETQPKHCKMTLQCDSQFSHEVIPVHTVVKT